MYDGISAAPWRKLQSRTVDTECTANAAWFSRARVVVVVVVVVAVVDVAVTVVCCSIDVRRTRSRNI